MAESDPHIVPELRPASRTVVPGAAMIAVSFGLARYGYGLLLPEMQAELAISPGAAGLISSGTYLSYLAANIGVVAVTSRFGVRAVIGLAAALAAAGMTTIATAHSVPMLATGVLIAGAAAGLGFPPYADLVAQHVPERRRDLAWSTISSGTGWGVAIAGPIAIAAGDRWRLAWSVFVALAIAVGAVAVFLAPTRNSGQQLRRPQLSWTWFFCPKSRPLLISAVLIGTGSAVWWAFSVDALREAGVDATSARTVYAVCGAAGILASASGTVFARHGLRTGYLTACTLLAASLAVLASRRATWLLRFPPQSCSASSTTASSPHKESGAHAYSPTTPRRASPQSTPRSPSAPSSGPASPAPPSPPQDSPQRWPQRPSSPSLHSLSAHQPHDGDRSCRHTNATPLLSEPDDRVRKSVDPRGRGIMVRKEGSAHACGRGRGAGDIRRSSSGVAGSPYS